VWQAEPKRDAGAGQKKNEKKRTPGLNGTTKTTRKPNRGNPERMAPGPVGGEAYSKEKKRPATNYAVRE